MQSYSLKYPLDVEIRLKTHIKEAHDIDELIHCEVSRIIKYICTYTQKHKCGNRYRIALIIKNFVVVQSTKALCGPAHF